MGKHLDLGFNKKVAGAEGGACHFFYYNLLAAAEELIMNAKRHGQVGWMHRLPARRQGRGGKPTL